MAVTRSQTGSLPKPKTAKIPPSTSRCGYKPIVVVTSSMEKLIENAKLDRLSMLAKATDKATGKNGKKKTVKDITKHQDF